MKKLQFFIAVLIGWLIFLFNIERLTETVDIRSYTYIFVALIAVIVVVYPSLSNRYFWLLLFFVVPTYLILKTLFESGTWQKNLFEGFAFPVTFTQVGAIVLTGILARQISYGLVEFNQIIHDLTFGRIGALPHKFSEEQGVMYNEVKRARRFHRPLSILALKANDETIQRVLPRMVEEVQQAMLHEYAYAGMARILDENLLEHDIIVRRSDYFLILLPETTAENVPAVINKISEAIKARMNIKLETGVANFPDDGATFERLVELAMQRTNEQNEHKEAELEQVASQSKL